MARKKQAKQQGTREKRKEKQTEEHRMWLSIGIGLILVALLVAIYSEYIITAGQAYEYVGIPFTGPLDLTREDSVVLRVLPENTLTMTIRLSLVPGASLREYTFVLEKESDTMYSFSISGSSGSIIAEDLLFMGTTGTNTDAVDVYLDTTDLLHDLQVSYEGGEITITNLHFIPPDSAEIVLLNDTGMPYPTIIHVAENDNFIATINASSSAVPLLDAVLRNAVIGDELPTLDTSITPASATNFTTALLTWNAPHASGAYILDITADVLGQETHAFYTIAVGDVVYALQDVDFPSMTLTDLGSGRAQLNITFAPTREFQALALPCDPLDPDPDTIFAGAGADLRLYSYDASTDAPITWEQGVPSDIGSLSLFRGYFVELERAEETTVSLECNLQNIRPLRGPPPLGAVETETLYPGWNLFSLPGTIPRALTSFTPASFELFVCEQNYECSELPATTPLEPGKPYWVFTNSLINLGYTSE